MPPDAWLASFNPTEGVFGQDKENAQHRSGQVFSDLSLLPFTVTEVKLEESLRSWAAHEKWTALVFLDIVHTALCHCALPLPPRVALRLGGSARTLPGHGRNQSLHLPFHGLSAPERWPWLFCQYYKRKKSKALRSRTQHIQIYKGTIILIWDSATPSKHYTIYYTAHMVKVMGTSWQ